MYRVPSRSWAVSPDQRSTFTMKIRAVIVVIPVLLSLAGAALAADESDCYNVCNQVCEKCSAKILNLPEPRTIDELQSLEACENERHNCDAHCAETGKPTENVQKDEPEKEHNEKEQN